MIGLLRRCADLPCLRMAAWRERCSGHLSQSLYVSVVFTVLPSLQALVASIFLTSMLSRHLYAIPTWPSAGCSSI